MPDNFSEVLQKYTEKGFRVIAVGEKVLAKMDALKLRKLHRQDAECDLTFIGLVIFENKLKPETIPVIDELRKARMEIMMLTGTQSELKGVGHYLKSFLVVI